MKTKSDVLHKLQIDELFRERKHRAFGIAQLLIRNHNVQIHPQLLADMLVEAESMSRYWRMILGDEHHELRGNDYSTGKVLAQNYQIKELEYESGFEKNVKQLRMLK